MSVRTQIINIISNCATSERVTGPDKVFINTCKGFELIGQPYVVNRNLSDYSWNWIHDSVDALIEVALRAIPAVIGPNLVVLPKDLPRYRPRLKGCIYLQPSEWALNLWRQLGFSESILAIWPAGIDTSSFAAKEEKTSNDQVLIYFKNRPPDLLSEVKAIVKNHHLVPNIISYGDYTEEQYRNLLAKCCFVIWLGCHESQGIALQEALAADVPMIVIDAKSLFDTYSKNGYTFQNTLRLFRTSSAPYFDSRCGIIIDEITDLGNAIIKIKSELSGYNPREYVIDQLSLEVSANKLVNIFNQLKVKNNKNKVDLNNRNEFRPSYGTRLIIKMNRAHNSIFANHSK